MSKAEGALARVLSLREQVTEDRRVGGRHRLMGETAKRQAGRLRQKIDRRRLQVRLIDWE